MKIGIVGARCPDWHDLLFERPQAPRLPDGFWEAVDILHKENDIMYAAMDDSGVWYLYGEAPTCDVNYAMWRYDPGRRIRTTIKPSNVHWLESLTRRPFLRIGQTEADK